MNKIATLNVKNNNDNKEEEAVYYHRNLKKKIERERESNFNKV